MMMGDGTVEQALGDKASCKADSKLLEQYVREYLFPLLVYIPVRQEKEMLDSSGPAAKGFLEDKKWRNKNNPHMTSTITESQWRKYQRGLWEKSSSLIKKKMCDLRTTMYSGVRAVFWLHSLSWG